MGQRIRHASFYINGRKLAECNSGELDFASGDESQIGDEGYIGHSDGADTSTLSTESIVPVAGMQVRLTDAYARKQYVQASGALIDGKIFKCEMRIVSLNYKSDAKSGSLMQSAKLEGGRPKFVG